MPGDTPTGCRRHASPLSLIATKDGGLHEQNPITSRGRIRRSVASHARAGEEDVVILRTWHAGRGVEFTSDCSPSSWNTTARFTWPDSLYLTAWALIGAAMAPAIAMVKLLVHGFP